MKVEFIESYIHDEKGGDYQWNDNHGELIRCEDCKFYNKLMLSCPWRTGWDLTGDDYCSWAERRES